MLQQTKGNIYRLKGKTPNSWALRQKEVGITTEKGYRFMDYFPGGTSLLVDENVGRKNLKIRFEFNGIDATEFIVPPGNTLLNEYLQKHPRFNIDYELFSEEISAERKLLEFEKKEIALNLIKETNDFKIQATAIAVFGMEAFGWPASKSLAQLKEKAFSAPDVIINKFEDQYYEARYLAALVFGTGIVQENSVNSAVIWNDSTKGVIVHLAKGENGLLKLGEFLAANTDESRLVLQEFGIRIDKANLSSPKKEQPKTSSIDTAVLSAKDREIEELKAKLAELETPKELSALEKAQIAYKEKFGKVPGPNVKDNLEWLLKKLSE